MKTTEDMAHTHSRITSAGGGLATAGKAGRATRAIDPCAPVIGQAAWCNSAASDGLRRRRQGAP